MSHTPAYDPLDTITWMLGEARAEVAAESYVTPEGKVKKKTKAQRADDVVRFETLCAVIWNVTGRSEPLEAVTERALAA
ncbi:MAG: hypothetical protein AB7V62_02360 [Thermoleophilia bacterium]